MNETDMNASEERVNVDRRWLGTSGVGIRVLAAGLVLLAAGYMVLGWGSRSRQLAANGPTTSLQSPRDREQVAVSPLAQALSLSAETKPSTPTQALSVLAGLPLRFEPNQGQANLDPADPRARFMARGSGYGLFLGTEGATLSLISRDVRHDSWQRDRSGSNTVTLQMKLAGANPNASLIAADALPGESNYLIGNDPAKWRRHVPQFAQVQYKDVYPGINLVFYGNQGRLEYDFQVAPGSDPKQAELEFDGAKQLELKDGALVIKGEGSSVRLEAPRVYQEIAGHQQLVDGSFVLRGENRAGFAIGTYDHSRELVIDPVLTFATYFGGAGDEHSTSVAIDGPGNIYLAGSTTSPTLPGVAAGVLQTTPGGAQNVYIAKINPVANPPQLVYVTYLGGTGPDYPVGIAVDGAGDPFVAGATSSPCSTPKAPGCFPTTATAYQTTIFAGSTGTQHVFVTELSNDASTLVYSSYLSGNGTDTASGMTTDSAGDVFVTGTTTSSNAGSASVQFPASAIPQPTPFQDLPEAATQFFVTKVDTQAPTVGSIAYSTYFGGGNFVAPLVATGGGIAVDTNGDIYFTGTTNFIYTGCAGCSTTDFPIKNAYQPCLNTTPPTVIVNPATCDTSATTSNSDAFVAKLNPAAPAGSGQLLWSTYIGGTQNESGTGIALDSGAANVYITGTTNSFPVTTISTFGEFEPCLDGPGVVAGSCSMTATASDAFVARLSNPTITTTVTNIALTYFSYLGGSGNDEGLAITVDNSSGAIVTGWTQSSDFPVFPTSNDIQGVYSGNQDAFVARLNTATVTGQTTTGSWASYYGGTGMDEGTSVALDVSQNAYFAGDTTSTDLQVSHPLASDIVNNGGYDAFVAEVSSAASLSITGVVSLGPGQNYISAGNQATFVYTLTNNGPDLANNITITDDLSSQITKVTLSPISAAATNSGICSGASSTSTNVVCNIPSLQSGSTATITIVVIPTANTGGGSEQFNGGAVTASAANNITPATATVTANMSDFALGVSPNNVAVQAAGQPATYQVQLTPNPVYSNSISLAVSGLPSGPTTATFTTQSVTLAGNSPSATTLTISTTARPIVTPAAVASLFNRQFYAIWLCAPGLTLLGVGVGGNRRRRRIVGMLMLCLLFMFLLMLPACSTTTTTPPVSGTPAGTYPLTVAATSGSDTKNFSITLTVP